MPTRTAKAMYDASAMMFASSRRCGLGNTKPRKKKTMAPPTMLAATIEQQNFAPSANNSGCRSAELADAATVGAAAVTLSVWQQGRMRTPDVDRALRHKRDAT